MFKQLMFIAFLLSTFFISFGAIEQFTVYDSKITFNDDSTFTVERLIHIRNVHDVGIVPGEFEFELFSAGDEDLKIVGYNVLDRYNNNITSRLIENRDRTSIVLNLFTPILPGFESVIKMEYTVEYNPAGLLFKRVQIPLKDATRLPILDGEVEVNIEDKYTFTYLSFYDNSTILNDNNVTFQIDQNSPQYVLLEYSRLPIRLGNYPGSLIFWLFVNFVMIGILAFQLRKELKKLKEDRF